MKDVDLLLHECPVTECFLVLVRLRRLGTTSVASASSPPNAATASLSASMLVAGFPNAFLSSFALSLLLVRA